MTIKKQLENIRERIEDRPRSELQNYVIAKIISNTKDDEDIKGWFHDLLDGDLKTYMAWFGFEATAYNLARLLGIEA